ncbi:DNA primase family protein [Brevibacillus halotolerans]|uniref:DNA primase family protein n=1 Tax=Brevibacillus halotolerans TaxID=1507437 RepID=UPI0015EE5146|nr:DUF5906 domain-containing protein [Brevibacillus halotolerans]MBA4532556.1 DNA primase [Brevibacillus halotolerans]
MEERDLAGEYIEYVDGEKFARRNPDIAKTHEFFKSAGKILSKDDVVVDIDCLEKDVIKNMITYFNIKTELRWTDRGVHMWFKKPKSYKHKAEGICALGFKAEWKISKTTNSVTVKRCGVLREVENEGVRDELPDFLTYIKNAEDLQGLENGDGRNSKLHSHKFKVMHLKEDHKKIFSFINNNIFAEPLEDDEFNTVIRDEKIKAEKNNEYIVARQLIKKLKIVKFNDHLYSFDGTRYRNGIYFKYDVAQELAGQSSRYIDEVIKQMDMHLLPIEEPSKGWCIKFNNGFLWDGDWWDIDFKEFTPYYIDIPYNPDAEPVTIVDQFLETFTGGEKDYRDFILEIIAHCLITDIHVKRNRDFQRVFFFIGDGGNGKGTLLNVIRALLGTNNVSSISLDRITDERYLVSMLGKLANCGDDIEDKPIKEEKMKMLKNLSSSDVIPLRELYKHSKDEAMTASQIFTTNHLLKSFEKGHAWKRRAVWCPSFGKPKAYDPHFQENLTSPKALEYWSKLVIEAYFRLYENRKFTEPEKVKNYTESYHMENNSCIEWVRNVANVENQIIGLRTPEAYGIYEIWAIENGLHVQSPKQLKKTIEEELGFFVHDTTHKDRGKGKFWTRKVSKY